jgi:gp178
MKLDDLIKHYENLAKDSADVNTGYIINNLKEFRILNKPHVDQFIADWYEEYKDNLEYSLWEWMRYEPNREKNKKFYLWLNDASNKPVETLVKMKLFGYSVEKEKKYIIKLKNVQKGSESFKFDRVIEKWYFGFNQESSTTRLYHTKEDLLNAGFGWMFSCPGFEIEEVEE